MPVRYACVLLTLDIEHDTPSLAMFCHLIAITPGAGDQDDTALGVPGRAQAVAAAKESTAMLVVNAVRRAILKSRVSIYLLPFTHPRPNRRDAIPA